MNNSTNSNPNLSEQSDLKKTLGIFLAKWYWFPVSILFALIVAKTYNELITPVYRTSCNIVIGDDLSDPVSNSQIIGTRIDFNRVNPINKEIGILKSKKLAEETIEALNLNYQCFELKKGGKFFKSRLYSDLPFYINIDSNDFFEPEKEIIIRIIDANTVEVNINSNYDITKVLKVGQKFIYKKFSFTIKLSDGITDLSEVINKRFAVTFKSKYSLASEFADKLKVEIDPTSQNIIKLSLVDENLYQSINYLNKLCELYIQNDINIRNIMAIKTIQYIDVQMGILSTQLNNAEDSLINFKRNFNVVLSDDNSMMVQNYYEIEKELEVINYRERSIKNILKLMDTAKTNKNFIFPEILFQNENLGKQLENLNRLNIERDVQLKNQSKNSPTITLIDQQIDVNKALFIDQLGNELNLLQLKKSDIIKQLRYTEAQILSLPEDQRKKIAFEREFKLTENIYNIYQQKRIEAILAKESTVSKIRVLDPPRFEDRLMVSPRKGYNMRIALILSLIIPAALIILLRKFSDRVDDINEIRSKTRCVILGKIYHTDLETELPVINYPLSPITESFYKLFTRLKFLKPEPGVKIISVTSGASGDGKTFCASNLASAMALSGKKVILLNLDLRRPMLHKIFDLDISPGFSDYLLNRTGKESIISHTSVENLHIIKSGPIPPDPMTLISQNKLVELFKELTIIYDYIVIDTPPIGMVADAMIIGKLADLTLMLVRTRYTRKAVFDLIEELQESNNIENLALVINDIKTFNTYGNNYYYKYYHTKEKRKLWKRR